VGRGAGDRAPDLVELGDGVAELLDLRVGGGGHGSGGHRDPGGGGGRFEKRRGREEISDDWRR
jgi:hypothetical protein